MIDNAIFKLCEQKNIFLRSIDLRITVFARFLAIINKLPQQQKKYFFPLLLRIFSLQLFLHSSLRLTVQTYPGCESPFIYFKNQFSFVFSQPIVSAYPNKFSR